MRCVSCDSKTHLVKDCYDTYERLRARLQAQTLKGEQLIAEEKGSDDENQPVFFIQSTKLASCLFEDVFLQVKTTELKTLGGYTSGCMLLDCG